MKAVLVPCFLLALVSPAIAQPAGSGSAPAPSGPVARMTPPSAWVPDPGRAEGIIKGIGGERPFGGVAVGLDAQYLRSPMPGGILISSQVVTETMPDAPDAAASAELHAARAGADAVDGAQVVRWEIKLDPAGRVHQALLEWTDPAVGTTVLSRTLVFRTSKSLARIAAECILGPDAAGLRPTCEQTLATLTANDSDLQPLAISATPPAAGGEEPPLDGPRLDTRPPTLGEGGPIPSTIMVSKPEKKADRRPLYVLGGVFLLGLVFWWNRKNRREFEAREAESRIADARARNEQKADDDEPAAKKKNASDDDEPEQSS